MNSSNEEYSEAFTVNCRKWIITDRYKGNSANQTGHSVEDLEGNSVSGIGSLKKAMSINMSRGRSGHDPYTAIDPEIESGIIGGVGWYKGGHHM